MTTTKELFQGRAAEARRARADAAANANANALSEPDETEEVAVEPAPLPPVNAPRPDVCACAKVTKVSELLVRGHGRWLQGTRAPLTLSTASDLRIAHGRGEVEIVIGVADPPYDTSVLSTPETFGGSQTFEGFKRSRKTDILRVAKELLVQRPHATFAEKSPFEIAAEELWSKRQSNVDKVRTKAQADYHFLTTQPLQQGVTDKRAEADRLMAEAEAAEALLASVSFEGSDATREQYELRAALEPFVKLANGQDTGVGFVHVDAKAEIKALVGSAIRAMQKADWAAVRNAVDALRAVRMNPGDPTKPAAQLAIGGGY